MSSGWSSPEFRLAAVFLSTSTVIVISMESPAKWVQTNYTLVKWQISEKKFSCNAYLFQGYFVHKEGGTNVRIYNLRSSGISPKSEALMRLWDIARKRNEFSFVFYCFENPSVAPHFGTTGLIQVRFQQHVPLQMITPIK